MKQFLSFLSVILLTLNALSCQKVDINNSTVKADKILADLAKGKAIAYSNVSITGTLDFTKLEKYFLSQSTEIVYCQSPVSFVNCTFKNALLGQSKTNKINVICDFSKNMSFINCTFKAEVNFDQCVFHSSVNFNQSNFAKAALFRAVEFRSSKNFFMETSFEDNLIFTSSWIYGNINFMKSVFNKQFSLQKVHIIGKTFLGACKFLSYTDLGSATFSDNIDFKYTDFTNQLILSNAKFKGNVNFADAVFSEKIEAQNINFYQKIIFSKNTSIPEKNIFTNCHFWTMNKTAIQDKIKLKNCSFNSN